MTATNPVWAHIMACAERDAAAGVAEPTAPVSHMPNEHDPLERRRTLMEPSAHTIWESMRAAARFHVASK